MSGAANRRVPPDNIDTNEEARIWGYLSGADEWQRIQITSGGNLLAELSAADEVAIVGRNSANDRGVIYAEQIDAALDTASALGIVEHGISRALEGEVAADELRAALYARDEGGNLHSATAETLGSGITSGAAGLVTYGDARTLQSLGLDERRAALFDAGGQSAVVNAQGELLTETTFGSAVDVRGQDDQGNYHLVAAEQLVSALPDTEAGLLTYGDRALQAIGDDVQRAALFDAGGQSAVVTPAGRVPVSAAEPVGVEQTSAQDVRGQDREGTFHLINAEQLASATDVSAAGLMTYGDRALRSVDQDELEVVIFGLDEANNLQEVGVEQLNQQLTGTAFGQVTYADRTLQSVASDVSRVALFDANEQSAVITPAGRLPVSAATPLEVDQPSAIGVRGPNSAGTLEQVYARNVNSALDTASAVGLVDWGLVRALQGEAAADEVRQFLQARRSELRGLQVPAASISAGNAVSAALLSAAEGFTLFLSAANENIVDVELSPNGGADRYRAATVRTSGGGAVEHFVDDASWLRVQGRSAASTKVQVRETV